MCGIFGFMLRRPVELQKVFRIMEKLEIHQYPEEQNPVGGYGAGIALRLDDGSVVFDKVGKVNQTPTRHLAKIIKKTGIAQASVLIAHVRMPSPEFFGSARLRETAQPYVAQIDPSLTVASVHNGKVENYMEIRKTLGKKHVLESEKAELIDSEVIPHYFVEVLSETGDVNEALNLLFCRLRGSNTIGLLHVDEDNTFLHLIHKGRTRGLTIWENEQGEIMFCSRREPVIEELGKIMKKLRFKDKVSIRLREDAGLRFSFELKQ